jgi:trimeric autotransporter adhesin
MKKFLHFILSAAFGFAVAGWVGITFAQNFVGPSSGAGSGQGAIGLDSNRNLAIGTSTATSTVKLLIVGTSTGSGYYAIEVLNAAQQPTFVVRSDGSVSIGGGQILNNSSTGATSSIPGVIGSPSNGGLFVNGPIFSTFGVSVNTSTPPTNGNSYIGGTLTVGNLSGGSIGSTVSAANVTAGVFGAGNFAFQSSLGINTSTQVGLPANLTVYGTSQYTGTSTFLGFVGIGTSTAPAYPLDLNANVTTAFRISGNTNPGIAIANGSTTKFTLGIPTGAGNFITGSAVNDVTFRADGGGKILFSTSATGATNDLTLSSGNVGIGTTSPGALLHVASTGGGTFTGLLISNTPAGTGVAPTQISFSRSTNSKITGAILSDISGAGSFSDGYISFLTRTSESVTEKMRINNSGNVGIGTTAPSAGLQIEKTVGADAVGGSLILSRNDSTNWRAGSIFSYYYSANASGHTDTLSFAVSNSTTSPATVGKVKMVIDEGGNVGIGTTAPSSTLHVAGHITSGGSGTPTLSTCGSGGTTMSGNDTAGAFTTGASTAACTVTFATAYSGTPVCVVSSANAIFQPLYITTTASSFTVTLQSSASNWVVDYICLAK